MSDKREQIRAIFIEEAGEIIEKLDIDIIRFEEDAGDPGLINEIFRGVHTLKGNANAFGFTRLGEFVHHFEDLLDHYRTTRQRVEPVHLDLFVTGVDVIKDVMEHELDGKEGLPAGYEEALERIMGLIQCAKGGAAPSPQEGADPGTAVLTDLALEFGMSCSERIDVGVRTCGERLLDAGVDPQTLYFVEIRLDEDGYRRGFDPIGLMGCLAREGTIVESYFDLSEVPDLETFDPQSNRIGRVSILLRSSRCVEVLSECFEFLFDHEYSIVAMGEAGRCEEPPCTVGAPLTQALPTPDEHAVPVRRSEERDQVAVAKSTIRIDTGKLDELFDSVGELVIAQNFIAQNEQIRGIGDEGINRTIETLTKITKRIQDRVMSLRMVAIKDTFDKMKRVVRDTAKKTGKEVRLVIHGEETEIDKTMIDSLSDPLIHIIRNAIDHGLEEDAAARVAAGKDAEGTVTLRAFHKSGNIIISISDDGRGINKERVLAKAIERGIVTGEENLTESQIFGLIMQPGFSTAAVVSDLSGRGVGLDVVKTSIEKLRGKIEIDSQEGRGTTLSMVLPLTLAIIDGMLVTTGGEIYIIPTLSVLESFRPDRAIVHSFKGRGEFVNLRDQYLPIARLGDLFDLPGERRDPWDATLVCVQTAQGPLALMVDELVGRQQVVIKSLGKSLSRIAEVSGGAILGNGEIALILNVDALRGGGGG